MSAKKAEKEVAIILTALAEDLALARRQGALVPQEEIRETLEDLALHVVLVHQDAQDPHEDRQEDPDHQQSENALDLQKDQTLQLQERRVVLLELNRLPQMETKDHDHLNQNNNNSNNLTNLLRILWELL